MRGCVAAVLPYFVAFWSVTQHTSLVVFTLLMVPLHHFVHDALPWRIQHTIRTLHMLWVLVAHVCLPASKVHLHAKVRMSRLHSYRASFG